MATLLKNITTPYFYGWLALIVMYGLSIVVTFAANSERDKKVNPFAPWALAIGHNGAPSASLVQLLVFSVITIFAYCTTYAARVMFYLQVAPNAPLPALPDIPINLLILMGLSVVTASSSKGITVSNLQQNEVPSRDNSNLGLDRAGRTELPKVQMLIWTFIAATIYLVGFIRFIDGKGYVPATLRQGYSAAVAAQADAASEPIALPDIDGALLVLMGAAQGGYVAGKLVNRSTATPIIDRVLPQNPEQAGDEVVIEGNLFGDVQGDSRLTVDDAIIVGAELVSWDDTEIKFKVPASAAPASGQPQKKVIVRVRVERRTSEGRELIVGKK